MTTPQKIIFHGKAQDIPLQESSASLFLQTTVKEAYQIAVNRNKSLEQIVEVAANDLIEMEFENGFIRIMTPDQINEEFPGRKTRSTKNGKPIDAIHIPNYIDEKRQSRGIIKNILKYLKIISVEEQVAKLSALVLTKNIETKLISTEGLFYCFNNPNLIEGPVLGLKSNQPVLLLLHGTALNAAGSFGSFLNEGSPSQAWIKLKEKYKKQIITYEHKTLSKSPLENAVHLLESLPQNCKLDIISHSRGGLIGEILARYSSATNQVFSPIELDFLKSMDRTEDLKHAERINALMSTKNISVGKFVRVACPVSGTTLASKRLDDYFTVLLNLIGLIPGLMGNSIYGYIKSFLIAFVKNKENINILPGLESMMPESPLIRVLNNASLTVNSELYVISGDVKYHGIFHSLSVLLADVFFRTEHDFVVNTASMFGGATRQTMYYTFNSNKDISHFKYFYNKSSQGYIASALLGDTADFKKLTQETAVSFEASGVRGVLDAVSSEVTFNNNKPIVYVVPGIMGSKLRVKGDRIWVNPLSLVTGGMERIKSTAKNVEAYGLMGSAYRSFLKELRKKNNVIPFPFDWRKSTIEAAHLLAADLKIRLETTSQPIRIVAHSMGGLVIHALYSLPEYEELWEELVSRKGARVLFLGSPLKGSHMIPSLFLKKNKPFKILHRMDLKNSAKKMLDIIKDYQGLLELLPIDAEHAYFETEVWDKLNTTETDFAKPSEALLSKSIEIHELIKQKPLKGEALLYVAGKDRFTPHKLDFTKDGAQLMATSQGDGSVTWATGIPDTLQNATWYMNVTHGKMCDEKKHFPALMELLESGTTNLLSQSPIVVRGEQNDMIMPNEDALMITDQLALEKVIMGIHHFPDVEEPNTMIAIEISHGDLGNAKYPVAVGHHINDPIVSAESVVDYYMNYRLSKNKAVNVYPGLLETSLVMFNESPTLFQGAVVIGLGEYGVLNEGNLTKSVTNGMLNYAVTYANKNYQSKDNMSHIGISVLLIGSDYSGLPVKNSMRAILNGVIAANKKLTTMNDQSIQCIGHVEFIEIYEDRAIHAMHELIKLKKEPAFVEHVQIDDPYIKKLSGRRKRIPGDQSSVWWHRLKIEGAKQGIANPTECTNAPLKFVSLTDKARAEEEIKPTQRILIDKLIASSVQNNEWNEEKARTLFNLLIPNNFKDYTTDNKNILFILDENSAQYPWEILHLPNAKSNKPLVTQIGFIRQLVTKNYASVNAAVENNVLVVGNPKNPISSLPGAEDEAHSVAEIFQKQSFHVEKSIAEDGVGIINKLLGGINYKIIHFAGHGIIGNKPAETGVVLDNGILITAMEIDALPKTPEFAFINCCYLGKTEAITLEFNKLAANVGTQFIQKGVKAVVAAGWAVDDGAAKHFAEVLYNSLLHGETFGQAVQNARLSTYNTYPSSNTWAAYQCYGDPFYRLTDDLRINIKEKITYVDPLEVIVDVDNLTSQAEPASSRDRKNLSEQLSSIISQIPQKWFGKSKIVEAIANCYYELNLYENAMEYFGKLGDLIDGNTSLESMLRMANIQTKISVKQLKNPDQLTNNKKKQACTVILKSEQIIDNLISLGENSRRFGVKGGHFKRKCMVNFNVDAYLKSGKGDFTVATQLDFIKECLLKAIEAYHKASLFVTEQQQDYYAILNWATLETIYKLYDGTRKTWLASAEKRIKQLETEFENAPDASRSFWYQIFPAAIEIHKLLNITTDLKRKRCLTKLVAIYDMNWSKGGSVRKAENTLGHIDFLIIMLQNRLKFKIAAEKKKEIESIIESYVFLRRKLTQILIPTTQY
ncbi:CHAT domain-containing protein [Aquimarina agarivorans]|uniref:CHAT domain-containing protein n=1 Tax=Aquimarina agarivorans TaxID=980584 RepID=UPI000248F02F|nr:CHAT domain-containing protein [Aquimarina agarivorans]